MIRLDIPVLVEGKYDKITLENVIDATIIPLNGFRIFKDAEKLKLIKRLAAEKGIIVMTDSDSAGNFIRSKLKGILKDIKIINVYVPCLKGKEKRKNAPSKEGLLGVEGISKQQLLDSLKRSGVFELAVSKEKEPILKTDLFLFGLSGNSDSKQLRKEFLNYLSLPENLSPNAMLDILNTLFDRKSFLEVIQEWQEKKIKN